MKNNVIGLFSKDPNERFATWRTLRELRESLKELRKLNDNGKFDIAISKEDDIVKTLMDEYLQRKAA